MSELLIMLFLWFLMYCYLILSSVDFGASFYLFYGQAVGHQESAFAPIHDYLSPVSEIINICFVLLFAAAVSLSPEIFLNYQTQLAFSGILAVLLILLKGTCFTLSELLPKSSRLNRICIAGNGISGLLVPPVLSISMVVSEGGFDGPGMDNVIFFVGKLFTNIYFWSVMIITVVSIFYISSMFLTFFARSSRNETLSEKMRGQALFWSMPTVLASGFVFLGLEMQNPDHFMRTLNDSWMFLISLICLLFAVTLIFLKRWYGFSFLLVMAQYFFALFGYGLSHLPYIIYPDIQIPSAVAQEAGRPWFLLVALILSFGTVAAVLMFKSSMVSRNADFKRSNSK
ncbi:cytochrome d ubiquinol oxidase subunit II [Sporolactobacillus pectinivorans]|uniref:cytochrome d ubiquinol oxidase subunit II n=1 Tax=Sporolactobacillus pectinivorans TaxID=1591408 RepID=UPI000C263336|nr:cytochrome d ubiquinol oxidase subunit II [Sporolactobacillus pectinivorans]